MKRWRWFLLIPVSMLITFMLLALTPFIFIGWLNLSSMKKHEKLQNNTKLNLEYLDLATKKLDNSYNLILDKNLYDIEYIPLGGNNFSSPKTYIMKEIKTPLLKSVYLYSKKEDEFQVLLFQGDNKFLYAEDKDEYEGINFFIRVLGNFGFRKYILNDFLYDATKGNDFKKIEEIFWEYQKKK